MQAVWESLHVREQAWASVRRATGAHPGLADTAKTAPGHAAHGQEQWAARKGMLAAWPIPRTAKLNQPI